MGADESSRVDARLVDIRRQRPPHVDLFFDVVLHNRQTQPQWFLIPTKLTVGGNEDGPKGLTGAEIRIPPGTGRVVILRLVGNAEVQAVLLPAGAQVTLLRLPIAFYGERIPSTLGLGVATARELSIDGEPAHQWVSADLQSDAKAVVQADQGDVIASRFVPGLQQVDFDAPGARKLGLEIAVNSTSR